MHRASNSQFQAKWNRYKKEYKISEEQVMKNLLSLLESTNYTMKQENGQRTYGGPCPGWNNLPAPPSCCEVFVSQIPKSCFEDVLVPIFSSIGKIYELRLMLDFDGGHRGFGFVKFTTPEHAIEAIRRLDKFKLPLSPRPLRVMASRNSCEVEVSNLPANLCHITLENLVCSKTSSVTSLRWMQANRKLLIEYETHRDAAIARRFLINIMPELSLRDDVRVQLLQRSVKRERENHQMNHQEHISSRLATASGPAQYQTENFMVSEPVQHQPESQQAYQPTQQWHTNVPPLPIDLSLIPQHWVSYQQNWPQDPATFITSFQLPYTAPVTL